MEPFIGQIIMVGFNYAPRGWAMCDGRLLPISQNQALFSLLGTTYGGDGRTTFALPDLRGRCAVGMGQGPGLSNYSQGQSAGQEHVTLTLTQMPMHNHLMLANPNTGNANTPANNVPAAAQLQMDRSGPVYPINAYASTPSGTTMNGQTISPAGGSQPHNNMQPYLAMNYIIALEGYFPSRP